MMMKIYFKDLIIGLTQNEKVNANILVSDIVEDLFFNKYLDYTEFSEEGVNVKSFYDADLEYQLFRNLYSRFSDEVIYFDSSSFDKLSDSHQKRASKFMIKLLHRYQYVGDKYISLLTYYRNSNNKLLEQIKTTAKSTGKFNDTPQIEGNFIASEYTTNITTSEAETASDKDSLILRLKEIQDHYKLVYADFINEFKRVFVTQWEEL